MSKIIIGVDEMAKILLDNFGVNPIVTDEYCSICKQMNDGCLVGEDEPCPHDNIVEYRYFVMQHFKPFMVKE